MNHRYKQHRNRVDENDDDDDDDDNDDGDDDGGGGEGINNGDDGHHAYPILVFGFSKHEIKGGIHVGHLHSCPE